MIVPVSVHNKTYELTREHLEEMWELYKDELQAIGLQVKQNIVLIKGKRG
jgi:predicted RNase H-like HicB family nuclease